MLWYYITDVCEPRYDVEVVDKVGGFFPVFFQRKRLVRIKLPMSRKKISMNSISDNASSALIPVVLCLCFALKLLFVFMGFMFG